MTKAFSILCLSSGNVTAPAANEGHALSDKSVAAGMGIVEQLGEGVTDWKEGERVTAVPWPTEHGQGTWQVRHTHSCRLHGSARRHL